MPAIVVTSEAFSSLADQMAEELLIPDARIAVVSHPIGATPAKTLESWAEAAVEDLVDLLD